MEKQQDVKTSFQPKSQEYSIAFMSSWKCFAYIWKSVFLFAEYHESGEFRWNIESLGVDHGMGFQRWNLKKFPSHLHLPIKKLQENSPSSEIKIFLKLFPMKPVIHSTISMELPTKMVYKFLNPVILHPFRINPEIVITLDLYLPSPHAATWKKEWI